MKNLKKLVVLSLTALAVTACSGGKEAKYERAEDDDIYAKVLPEFEALVNAAKAESNESKRFVNYAKAEAYLMDSGLVLTTYSQGGSYAVTRLAPRTVPFVSWGNDDEKLKYTVAVKYNADKKFITPAEREELKELWAIARAGGAAYNPKAYLEAKGYEIDNTYHYYMTSNPQTFDILATSKARDSQYLVQGIEGLLEYDNLGNLQPRLAEALPELSEDKKTYTFTVAAGNHWRNQDGTDLGEVTAEDFVTGFQHMLDTKGGLQALVSGVVKNVAEYLKGEVTFDKVGVKANGNKVSYELVAPESYFPSRFAYTVFHPLQKAFYEARGGKFGAEFDATAESYTFGKKPEDICYNGPYVISDYTKDTSITLTKNAAYYDAANVNFSTLSFAFDKLDNRNASLQKAIDGTYAGWGLTAAVLDKAKEGGENSIFNKYAYVSDTNAVTFFGGMNVNRGTFEVGSVASAKTEQEKLDTENALLNADFRRAIQQAWDRETWNAVSVAPELATAAMRNMYTAPNFVKLDEAVTDGNKVFAANTEYGDIVEYYLKNVYSRKVDIEDGQDGWYHPGEALKFMRKAKAALEEEGLWNGKVKIEVVYNSQDDEDTKSKKAFETVIEEILGDYVDVVCLPAANEEDQLATSYDTESGDQCCYDISWDSGWGPDYGDPSTYVDTFLSGGEGYMCKVIGLY